MNRVESKKRDIAAKRQSLTGTATSTTSTAASSSSNATSLSRNYSKESISRARSKSTQMDVGDMHSRQNSKEPPRCSSKLRKLGFKDLNEYEEGELERDFVDKVQQGDDSWVLNCLAAVGRPILFSEWAGGVSRTCILYAAKQGDQEMCKILLAYGGKELLKVKDLKGRDGEYYAKLHGIDLLDLMQNTSRIDCWNHKALRTLGRSLSKQKEDEKKGGGSPLQGKTLLQLCEHSYEELEEEEQMKKKASKK
ncbi:unnamed protein product [Amoebophrya sp. A120]|nr:unnamed protein product [Amoebophrya sp. A120]|eukprot:GSA120T00000528001.1